jgi:hypothetical protein
MLRRFWFRTEVGLGYGVTAFSRSDAEQLLRAHGYPDGSRPIIEVVEDVDVSALDQSHVLLNSGPVVVRGVWYPCHNLEPRRINA